MLKNKQILNTNLINHPPISQDQRCDKLLKLLNRNRSNSYHQQDRESQPYKSQAQINKNYVKGKINAMRGDQKGKVGEEYGKIGEMGRTYFVNSYMYKMKKQRKRQQKKKPALNNTTNSEIIQSMYIFLPALQKNQIKTDLKSNRNDDRNMMATIDIFYGKGRHEQKMQKSRTFSMDSRNLLQNQNNRAVYEQKVSELIKDIKNRRKNSYKLQKQLQEQQQLAYQIPILPRQKQHLNSVEFFPQPTPNLTELPQFRKIIPSTIIKYREASFTGKKLQPWHSQTENHLIPQLQLPGIESYQFV